MPDRPESTALFAYGSLVHPESVAMTLGRSPIETSSANLRGWRRRFSVRRDNHGSEKTFSRLDGTLPEWILSLNLEPDRDSDPGPNGVLIEVCEAELVRLDRREIRYRRADVTADVQTASPGPSFERVVAYVAQPENLAVEIPPGSVVLRSYVEAVERAFTYLGADALAAFRATTEPPGAEVVDAQLAGGDIPPGNPRDW